MLRRSRVETLRVTKRPSSGTQRRRFCTLTCCHRVVLMFECDTLWACIRRLPVISLLAMTGADPSSGLFPEQGVSGHPASHQAARVPGQAGGEEVVGADRGEGGRAGCRHGGGGVLGPV